MSGIGGELSFAPDGSDYQRARTPGLPAWWRDSANAWERHATVDGEQLRDAGEVSAVGPNGELPDVHGRLEVVTAAGHPTLPAGRTVVEEVEKAWAMLQAGTATLGSRPARFVNLTGAEYALVGSLYGS